MIGLVRWLSAISTAARRRSSVCEHLNDAAALEAFDMDHLESAASK